MASSSASVVPKSNKPCLRVIPLGGLDEIGKNTCVFEYGDDIMLVDAGLAFPDDGMHGVNVVMPDTTYLRQNQKRIRGMIVTHGHEDHIEGISRWASLCCSWLSPAVTTSFQSFICYY